METLDTDKWYKMSEPQHSSHPSRQASALEGSAADMANLEDDFYAVRGKAREQIEEQHQRQLCRQPYQPSNTQRVFM